MADLQTLEGTHNIIKASFDAIHKFVFEFREGDNIKALAVRQKKLVERSYEWERNYLELERASPGTYTAEFNKYSELYFDIMTEIDTLMDRDEKPAVKVNNAMIDVKLPEIILPKFNGEYSQWRAFIDIFNSLIHNNAKLTPVQKLHYLKGALTGQASKIISMITLTMENYQIAYDLIYKTYNNQFLIINSHLQQLDSIPVITKGTVENLRAFLNGARQQVQALKAFFEPARHWDIIMLYMLNMKLDTNTKMSWNLSRTSDNLPTLIEFFTFLEARVTALEHSSGPSQVNTKSVHTIVKKSTQSCLYCKGQDHMVYQCQAFKSANTKVRKEFINKHAICKLCLASCHTITKCKFKYNCAKCREPHNTLLHEEPECEPKPKPSNPVTSTVCVASNIGLQTLLSTVSLVVVDVDGTLHTVRALLDSGSQINLISASLVTKLKTPTASTSHKLSVLQGKSFLCNKSIKVAVRSRIGSFSRNIQCIVVDQITHALPSVLIDYESWKIPDKVSLADPEFNIPGEVDMLIGVELYFEVLKQGCIRLGKGLPILRDSSFGWLISGVYKADTNGSMHVGLISNEDLHNSLTKFWQLEEVPENNIMIGSDKWCEDYFNKTVERLPDGRFTVALPFVDGRKDKLGSSFDISKHRFLNLERRFARDEALFTAYVKFIQEYISLGHAEPIQIEQSQLSTKDFYFLPHHPVIKDGDIKKIRVVFDASAKSNLGTSLNNVLHVGPKLQQDLCSILIRFRCHQYVFVTDIVKMYRQIKIREHDQNFQVILWREDPKEQLKFYRLTTVTYGTACAPYLAMRCLKSLAQNNSTAFPHASRVLKRDCYVDDIITGMNTSDELIMLQNEIIKLLDTGGFSLHKWSSNCKVALESLPKEKRNPALAVFTENGDIVKTLGLAWNPSKDYFIFSHDKGMVSEIADTKRSVLSTIAQIYDPIGLLAPVTITAKLVMQELWKLNIAWDDALPQDLQAKWAKFKTQLSHLDKLYIPRGVFRSIPTEVQCHGFSDASMYAYGACIYFRATYADGSRSSQLVCSKSKIAPLKNITLPRLELSAALLLAKLYKHVMAIIDIQISDTFLWCDSSIVLAWLKTDPALLKMFVSNRIAEILDLTPNILWRHVPSKENAADLVSRGVSSPAELINYDLWWHGPSWLIEDPSNWPNKLSNTTVENIPERRVLVAIDSNNRFLEEVAGRFSNFNKLVRVVAYCLRWLTRIRRHIVPEHNLGVLLAAELRSATNRIVYLIQKDNFGEVLYNLKAAKQSNTSLGKLKALNPFIDADGLLRVGGRLENADINYDQKHPMILPKDNSVVKMLIKAEHERLLHAGTQTVLANIRLKYWPLDGRNTIKHIIHKCVKCARFRATNSEQLMGSLPRDRVTAHRPFQVGGVDFAGPVILRSSKLRKAPRTKAYIALFVCMATKAIHIELVTSLSTEGFLAALRRFVARRGCCSIIHSDNGKNFVGARNELRMLASLLRSDVNKQELITGATQMGITWQFTPSYAPHFGGLWEGSIKVMKHHLRRVIGSHCLTYEEYATILTQIEAILNSRPILALTDDSTDIAFISPGHFLIGEALTALPEPYVNNCNANLTKLYKVSSKMRDQFWSVWSKQYLSDLQKRKKWSTEQPNVQKDQIVLLKEDNMPPLHWPMGRIMDTKPGHDGKVRVVIIKTSNGTYTRPIAKVVPLPCE